MKTHQTSSSAVSGKSLSSKGMKRAPMTPAQVSRLRSLQKRIDSEVSISLQEKRRKMSA